MPKRGKNAWGDNILQVQFLNLNFQHIEMGPWQVDFLIFRSSYHHDLSHTKVVVFKLQRIEQVVCEWLGL